MPELVVTERRMGVDLGLDVPELFVDDGPLIVEQVVLGLHLYHRGELAIDRVQLLVARPEFGHVRHEFGFRVEDVHRAGTLQAATLEDFFGSLIGGDGDGGGTPRPRRG